MSGRLVEIGWDEHVIRVATKADLPFVISLLQNDPVAAHRESQWINLAQLPKHYERAFDRIGADPNNFLLVFESGRTLCGTFQLTFMDHMTYEGGLRMQIEGVRIYDSQRSKGLGKAMFGGIKRIAVQNEVRLMQLTCDRLRGDALQFYESLGFDGSHIGFKYDLGRPTT